MRPHEETYDVGVVRGSIYDVAETERQHRETRVVRVEESEGDVTFERVVDMPAELLWAYNVDPTRVQWQGDLAGIRNTANKEGRFAAGAEIHCDHGSYSRVNKVVDWRPFRRGSTARPDHVRVPSGGRRAHAHFVPLPQRAPRLGHAQRRAAHRPADGQRAVLGGLRPSRTPGEAVAIASNSAVKCRSTFGALTMW